MKTMPCQRTTKQPSLPSSLHQCTRFRSCRRGGHGHRALVVVVAAAALVTWLTAGSVQAAPNQSPGGTHGSQAVRTAGHARPKILVLRGLFEVFSLGLHDLAGKLRCRGYDASTTSWSLALTEVDCDDNRPLVVIGHSLGGRMCAWVSRQWKSCGRRVPLLIIVDANLWQTIPANVDKCVNLYVTNHLGIFHGTPVSAASPSTVVVNKDISQGHPPMILGGINHFDIDSTDWVHRMIIREIDATFGPPAQHEFAGSASRPDQPHALVAPAQRRAPAVRACSGSPSAENPKACRRTCRRSRPCSRRCSAPPRNMPSADPYRKGTTASTGASSPLADSRVSAGQVGPQIDLPPAPRACRGSRCIAPRASERTADYRLRHGPSVSVSPAQAMKPRPSAN